VRQENTDSQTKEKYPSDDQHYTSGALSGWIKPLKLLVQELSFPAIHRNARSAKLNLARVKLEN
jgi:hypothetical protein